MAEIKVITNMLDVNDELTAKNRRLLKEKGIYILNMMSSPGSGKTSILEKVIMKLKGEIRIAVIEGDLYTTKDAERIEAQGVGVVQINTNGACHLDARMIKGSLESLDLDNIDLLIIENVGNIVCPAEFELGEDVKIAVLSVTEGNDKPLKYPLMFEKSGVVILNKIDLLKYTNFNLDEFYSDVRSINNNAVMFETSCISGQGIDAFCDWIRNKINK